MLDDMANESETRISGSNLLPFILILFTASGCSALIYEIVWYQLLQLAIGSTAISLGILLATFMGGLCLGSVGASRFRAAMQSPLRVYAFLELGIAFCSIAVLFGIPYIDRVYIAGAGYGLPGTLLRALICAVCLLPPTVLMGASFPAIARWVESTPRGISWLGLLYSGNTAGAVFGCLFAGFYLLRIYSVSTATYVAAAINLLIALSAFWLAARVPSQTQAPSTAGLPGMRREERAKSALDHSLDHRMIFAAIALSGATALGAEVIWTRLMGMMLGATVYVFSIILAVFLIGLAIGGTGGSFLLRVVKPRLAFGWCQILLCLAIAWTAYTVAGSLPYWPINTLLSPGPWYTFQLDLVRCLWAILPATILWGASFPLALAALASAGEDSALEDSGRLVGRLYAANTFGAIVGALGVSLVLIPWIGTQQSQRLLLVLSAISALVVLAPYVRSYRPLPAAGFVAAFLLFAGVLAATVKPIPGEVIAYGRQSAMKVGTSDIIYTAEGRNSSVAISRWSDGAVGIDVNGHVEATTEPYDMKLQRMIGHLPALLHSHPQSVLGIGFGAGVSAGTFTTYPSIQKITVCEIEPIIPPISTRYFRSQDYDVMNNPRTRIVYDDARHYMQTTKEKFDIIASDPLDVFVKGTAALYSREYFEAVKAHLNPGGMFTLYVPLYESDIKTVQSEFATFFDVFPYGTIWANTRDGQGYDMVFMGQVDALKINVDEIQQRLERPDYAPVAQSMREIGFNTAVDLFATYSGQYSDLKPWLKGAEITRDLDLRLQYLAGWGIDSQLADIIYNQMLSYRRPPRDLFFGSDQYTQPLLSILSASFRSGTQP
jgi:spermidine synthase